MTITTELSDISYNGDAAVLVFPYPFKVIDEAHLFVTIDGINITQADTTYPWSPTDIGVAGGGDIVFSSTPPPTGVANVIVYRDVPATQEVDYTPFDSFPSESHEQALDKLTMLIQEVNALNDRGIHFPIGDAADGALPDAVSRASRVLGFDVNGDILLSFGSGSTAVWGDILGTLSNQTDLQAELDVLPALEASAAASAAAALVSETNAAASEISADADAISADADATSAANSAANSAFQAGIATTQAGIATTQAAAAAATYTLFDDRYLGSFASAPTTLNDGTTPLGATHEGAEYWSSTANSRWTWTGTAWTLTSGSVATSANLVSISDAGSFYAGADVEAALQEIGGGTIYTMLNKGSDQALPVGTTIILYDVTSDYNIANWRNPLSHEFLIPAGVSVVQLKCAVETFGGAGDRIIDVGVNGFFSGTRGRARDNKDGILTLATANMRVVAGDLITLRVTNNSGVALTYDTGRSYFQITKVV